MASWQEDTQILCKTIQDGYSTCDVKLTSAPSENPSADMSPRYRMPSASSKFLTQAASQTFVSPHGEWSVQQLLVDHRRQTRRLMRTARLAESSHPSAQSFSLPMTTRAAPHPAAVKLEQKSLPKPTSPKTNTGPTCQLLDP
jgi:hypothetical protein